MVGCQESADSISFYSEKADTLKMEFLERALLDKTEPRILSSKNVLMSNLIISPPLDYYMWVDDESKEVNRIEYLSYYLEEKDTSFLRKQIKEETGYLTQLSNHGFNILDAKKLWQEGISVDSIKKIAEQKSGQQRLFGESKYIMIGKPIFSKDLRKLYLVTAGHNYGKEYIFTITNDSIERYDLGQWIE